MLPIHHGPLLKTIAPIHSEAWNLSYGGASQPLFLLPLNRHDASLPKAKSLVALSWPVSPDRRRWIAQRLTRGLDLDLERLPSRISSIEYNHFTAVLSAHVHVRSHRCSSLLSGYLPTGNHDLPPLPAIRFIRRNFPH
jgi:hypothetical protein